MAAASVQNLTVPFNPSGLVAGERAQWYAAYTCARHEKRVAAQLEERTIECFLPLYETVRRWNNMRAHVQLPLFPGYVFVRLPLSERLRVLQLPSVVRLVGFNGLPMPLPDEDMATLRAGLTRQLRAEPHPYLKVGRRVRIKHGPFAGLDGVLTRRKNAVRLILSIDLIMRSFAVEVDIADLEQSS